MSTLDQALSLAAQGFHVFPLAEGTKDIPIIDGWQRKATRDPDQIRKWWVDPVMGWEHEYNIGICTTRFQSDKALVVVDVDNKNGKKGDEEIFLLDMKGFELPATREHVTPTGGKHLIYINDQPVKQGANVLAPGLDIRSKGGYIVAPGSVLPNGEYKVQSEIQLNSAPQWVVEKCGREIEKSAPSAPVAKRIDQVRAVNRAIEYLENTAPLAIESAGGDHTTFAVACKVKDFGVNELDCYELLTVWWNDRCSPPWSPDELQTKIANAYRYGTEPVGVAAPEVSFPPVVDTPAEDSEDIHPFQKLNKEYAFVLAGGGHHILWETKDEHGRWKLEHLNEASFHRAHCAKVMQVGKVSKPITKLWMDSPERRSYLKGICFRPGKPTPEGFYNLWRGFAVDPVEKGETPAANDKKALDMFLEHALENVCNGDKQLFKWLMGYFAHMIQRPYEKPLTALVFKGGKGVGKNALVERVGYLLGGHSTLTSNRRYLIGNFNGHLENLLMLTLDEAFWSGDKQAEGQIKDLITGKDHIIEHKGKEPYKVDNLTRVVVIGNEDWLVPASHDERRFAVFEVGDGRKQDRKFFQTMRELMEAGGYSLLLRYLLDYDLTGIDVNEAPNTEGLLEQKQASLEPFQQWWFDCLHEAKIVGSDFSGPWPKDMDTEGFRMAFKRYVSSRNIRSRIPEDRAIGRMLKKCAPSVKKLRVRDGERLIYRYLMPDLDTLRNQWEIYIGHRLAWE